MSRIELDANKFRKHNCAPLFPPCSKDEEQAFQVLDQMRRSGQMCDAMLRVDDKLFRVHRAVLAASSPYFKALFTHTGPDVRKQEIIIPDVTPDIMERIIEHAYVRRTSITPENIQRLLPAADQFHVPRLLEDCCKYIESQLEPENCLGLRQFAHTYFCDIVEKKATQYALKHFPQVHQRSQEILMLTRDELALFLSDDKLNAKKEEMVFECVIRWIDHDPIKRAVQIAPLLKCVRMGLLNTQYFIEKVKNHPYVRDNESCRNVVIEAFRLLCDLDMIEDRRFSDHPLTKARIPHELIIAIGGWSGGSPTNCIEAYDCRGDRWIDITTSAFGPRAYHGCVSINNHIYVIGGFDGMEYFNSVLCFHPGSQTWSEVAPMHDKRCYVSAATLNNEIYAMGGFNGTLRQNSTEKYDPNTNQWTVLAPMNVQRSDACSTVIEDKVFIAGGFNGTECLQSAELYDPAVNQWTIIKPMRNRRSGVSVVSYDGQVYVIGGFNGVTRLQNGEKWNPKTNSWSNIADMYTPRSNYGVEVIDDMICAIGGFNGVTTIHNVECYDPVLDEWYDCQEMGIFRSALSVCVIRDSETVSEFIRTVGTPDVTEDDVSMLQLETSEESDPIDSNSLILSST